MKTLRLNRPLTRYLFVALLTLLSASCGGGGGDGTPPNQAGVTLVYVIADTGLIRAVKLGNTVVLDGSLSKTNSDLPLSYAWSFTYRPEGSTAKLQNPNSVNPSFFADVTGTFMVQLVVRAGSVSSQRAIASVEVSTTGNYTGKRLHTHDQNRCGDCHDGRYLDPDVPPYLLVAPKSGDHLATSNVCEACHTTVGFPLRRHTDHLEVFENCSSCHNGVLATGKSPSHVETNAECDSCHSTDSFFKLGADGKYDHRGIRRGCDTCHNGIIAIGMSENHINTNSDCVNCHSTAVFKPATTFDHSTIAPSVRCDGCHNGGEAMGQPAGHPDMNIIGSNPLEKVDCGTCHNTTGFSLGGVYDHRRVASTTLACATCHTDDNTINARGMASDPTPPHPDTTADCGVCHTTGAFKPASFDHSTTTAACNTCHTAAGTGTPKGTYMTADHMPLPDNIPVPDCDSCHTVGTFTTGVFDHNLLNGGYNPARACADCHNGVISVGKLPSHVPTIPDNQDCAVCHDNTNSFIGATYVHVNINDNCVMCHDGRTARGKHRNHMPTTQDCSVCHSDFTAFTDGRFDHSVGVNNNCADCHNGIIALGKNDPHIPSIAECSQCHNNTLVPGGFAANTFLADVHPGMTGGCEGCHNSQFLSAKPTLLKAATHVPTDQDCHFCHSNVNFADKTKFTHAGITGNCGSCHNGNYFTSANAMGKAQATNPHPTTSADCGLCHGIGNNFTDGIYDHTGIVDNCSSCHGDGAPPPPDGAVTRKSSMTNPPHVTTTQDCSICHVPGTFATAVFKHNQIVSDCGVSCHGGPSPTATIKPPVGQHVDTADDCSACHNTTAFAGAKYDHTGITTNCASCHDGIIAKGKHPNHVPTNRDCSDCHQTTGFFPGTFDHAGVTGNCVSCHNGVFARDKNPGHLATTQDCGVCHTMRAFLPAVYDHRNVTTSTICGDCHVDGSATRTGKDDKVNPPHLDTSLDCRYCHNTTTFVGGSWVHDSTTVDNCDTCHIPGGAAKRTKLPTHLETTLQCDACHTTTAWAPVSYRHSSVKYPGDHRVALSCVDCHTTAISSPISIVYPFTGYQHYCAACHEDKFRPEGDHNGGSRGTVAENKDCSGGGRGCHSVRDTRFN